MLESIFLDFWKDKFIVIIICFMSLLTLCLELEIFKIAKIFCQHHADAIKNMKKLIQLLTYTFNISHNFKAREKFYKITFFFKHFAKNSFCVKSSYYPRHINF